MRRSYLAPAEGLSVIGAIEIALYDVLGQANGVPVYQLLGGTGTTGEVEVYASGGLGATVEQRVEQAVSYASEDYDIVKVRAMQTTDGTLELAAELTRELEPDVLFAIDGASAGQTMAEALELTAALKAYAERIAWLGDPVPSRLNLTGYKRLRKASDIPITGMESCVGLHEFWNALAFNPVDIIHPDVSRGGYAFVRQVTAEWAARDVPSVCHVWGSAVTVLANAHYAATDPNVRRIEFCRLENPLRDDYLPTTLERDRTTLTLPQTPGLGLDLPDDIGDQFPYLKGKGHVTLD